MKRTGANLLVESLKNEGVEVIFGYPGMGSLLHRALAARDYPLLQGILLLASVTVLAVNFLLELFYPIVDPRVKTLCISNTEKS